MTQCTTVYDEVESWDRHGRHTISKNVRCGGQLRTCDICGKERYCTHEARCLDGDTPSHVVKRRFTICDTVRFIGYTRGEHWNGWACPRFPKEEADKVMAWSNEGGEDDGYTTISYDPETDSYRLKDFNSDDFEDVPGEDMETPEGVVRVYAIGAWGWCWEEEPV